MLGEVLKPFLKAYFLLEEQYYKLLDSLEDQFSVPIYEYFVDPVESRGIPSFIIALLLFLLLVGGSLIVLTAQAPPSAQVLVLGKLSPTRFIPLESAVVELSDSSGVLFTKKTVHGLAVFSNVPSSTVSLRAQKTGFVSKNVSVNLVLKGNVRLELDCSDPGQCAAAYLESGVNASDIPYGNGSNPTDQYGRDNGTNNGSNNGNSNDNSNDNSSISFSNPDPDSPTGRLLVIVHDENGTGLDGQALVYDANSSGVIQYADVVKGSALVPNLAVGKQVYVDVMAQGFGTFFGNNSVITIHPATNKINVVLKTGASDFIGDGNSTCEADPSACSTPNQASIRVVSDNGSALSYAHVSEYVYDPQNSHPEVLHSDYTDNNGYVSLEVGNGSYFADADLDGYISNFSQPFKVNETVTIVLSAVKNPDHTDCQDKTDPLCGLGTNEARVLAHAVDETGANASYADMVLQQKTDFGAWFVKDQTTASNNGLGLFSDLSVGAQIKVLASSYDRSGQANATLVQGINRLEITIAKKPFLVHAFAFDPLSRQYVTTAGFQSFSGTKLVGQCQGNGCNLQMVSGQDVVVNASADGYIGSQVSFNLYDGVDSNVTLYLVSADALKDTFIQWQGLFDEQNRPIAGPLKPGHSYLARVQVFSKNADSTGVVLDTQNDGVTITGVDPQGFDMQGSYAGSCTSSPVNFENSQDSWIDVRYNGAQSGSVTFNVSLDPSMTLDPQTKTKTLSLAYRSYIQRGTNYLRNPYDPSLNTQAGTEHPSGCPVASYSQNYTVQSTGTSCNGEACVTLKFAQGDQQGTDVFDSQNQVLVGNTKLNPLYVYYTVELYAPINRSTVLSFNAPSNRMIVLNASSPFLGASTLGKGLRCDLGQGTPFQVLNSSFSLNLTGLTQCTNYGVPMRLDGVALARVLQDGSSPVSLSLIGVGSDLTHFATLNVAGFGVAANENAIVEATLGQPFNQNPDNEPFAALSTGNCTADLIRNGKCDVGFVNATFRITALTGNFISAQVQNDGPLQLVSVVPSSAIPVFKRGESVQGEADFLAPAIQGSSSVSIIQNLAGQSTALKRSVNVGGSAISFNSSEPFPAGFDTCNGYIGIKYDPTANPPLTLGNGCTDLAFRISTVFPADAIPLNLSIPDYGSVLTRVSATDGSDPCYEICEQDSSGSFYGCDAIGKTLSSGTQYLLRYNPEMRSACPAQYKVVGNSILKSSITLEFGFTGEQNIRRNVTLHVVPDISDPSLYLSPVYTMYSSTGRLYPQLWAVTNLKQLGPRTVLFRQPSNFALKFDGPGTQIVAINPNGGNIQAFDGSDLKNPVLDLSAGSSVPPVSRYSLALAAIYQSIDLNIPGFQQYTNALAATLGASQTENAFLDVNAANTLSGSVPKLAERTAYWRSSNVVRYCQQTSQCVSSLYTLPGCCRLNLDDWKNNTVQMDFQQNSCTYCNNTYNPSCTDTTQQHQVQYAACTYQPSSSVYQCDQRCTLKSSLPQYLQDSANQIGLTGNGVTILNYGDSLAGRTCQLQYSSLNAFVSTNPGTNANTYTYYNPVTPLSKISVPEVNKCQSNGNCPLVIVQPTPIPGLGTPSGSGTPQCVTDADQDGLAQPSEVQTNAVLKTATCVSSISSCPPDYYECPSGQIIAVSESAFYSPAATNGNLIPRSIATAADIKRCQSGLCPMLLNPATDPTYPNTPTCVSGPTNNGFLDQNTVGADQITPAMPTGFGSYQCVSGFLAVAKYCFSSCDNYCAKPNCDPSPLCLPSGASYVPTGTTTTVFNNWENQSPVVPYAMNTAFLSRGLPNAPASMFADVYQSSSDSFQSSANGKPVFSASYVVNSKNAPGALQSMPKVLSVDGCGGSDYPYDSTLLPQQGVYLMNDYNTLDIQGMTWVTTAKAVDLPIGNYIGARSDQCHKGNNWNTRLCETTFVDHSSQYGSCFNSILQYSGGPKRPGVDLSLVGGLGDGIKQGTGYAVAPSGDVFALIDPGTGGDYCGDQFPNGVPGRDSKHKYHVDLQTLHHWNAVGQYTGQKDFNWVKDLGCSKDCGCKSGGGYGLLQILLPLVMMALAFFVIGPAIGAAFTTSTTTVTAGGITIGTGSTVAAATSQALTSLAANPFLMGSIAIATTTTTSAMAGIVTGIVTAGLSAATSGLTGGMGSSPAIAAVNVASNVITTISAGNLGDCLSWSWGPVAAYACKGVLWTISGG